MLKLPRLMAALALTAAPALAQDPAAPPPLAPAPVPPPVTEPAPALQPLPPAEVLPPAVEPAPYPPTATLPAPLPPPIEEEKPAVPDRVAVGKVPGFFQPSALLQVWFVATKNEGETTDTTFRLRRAEFIAKGEIAPKLVSYLLRFDVAKTTPFAAQNVNVTGGDGGGGTVSVQQPGADRSVLQDVWMTYISDFADVSIGQFKIPVGMESLQSSPKLLFPERSRVVRQYGDRRDIGLRIDKKIGDVFYYQLGLYNGNGQNTTDNDRKKDGALRLELTPIPGLTVAAVGYATLGGRDENVRDRLEADLRYDANNVFFEAEYIHAWDGAPGTSRVEGHGAHGMLGYTIAERIQPVVRIGLLDRNVDAGTNPANSPLRFFEAGLNYMLRGYDVRLSLAGAYYSQKRGPDQGEVTFQSQVGF